MFDIGQDRYITKGIKYSLDSKLQIILWQMIEEARKEVALDYLQIFKLSKYSKNGRGLQRIIHTQEQPEYERTIYVPVEKCINEKVYVIDDKTHSTMLLASEY
ncbi:protein of unknown function [Orenia metallireducens]|uniref:Uncharacterized protein n=1 Tax=Orenia metallireducens TaxID=1413210 RepID=A0A285GXB6_9FIRM|nr:DUF960 family protein [Orenia metallireducens]SNY26891.1 protein of unknown function [Orenia metallireducens]